MEEWRQRDAITRCEKRLIHEKILAPEEIETLHEEIEERIKAAVEKARQDPYPEVKEVEEHVYA
jgi:pyruvate dehydrogenase E1 component alpha subunit